jgi:hypothetical protein
MRPCSRIRVLVMAGALTTASVTTANACPFCSSVSQTLTEEINAMQTVAVARLTEAPPSPEDGAADPSGALPKAKFRIQDVIKGSELVQEGEVIEVLYFGEANKDRPYLVMGTDAPQIVWSTPLGLSQRAYEYVLHLPNLPTDFQRLEFFQDYLEDEDEMLARDAYDEFAKAPYKDLIDLKDSMPHDRLIEWIKDRDVPASRRRLYFTMLGVCGEKDDVPLLHSMMHSTDRQAKAGLDALLACYLLLAPDEGLAEVEELFLKNKQAEYADTYAAIMAIRFHGNETDKISKERLIKSLRYLLNRPELADLVIPDLARWQDWEVMPQMVQLFKEADEKSSWVRVPVINYLRSCPLPEAKKYIDELAKIDPESVKRAQTFFPFDAGGDGGTVSQPEPSKAPPNKSSGLAPAPADRLAAATDAAGRRAGMPVAELSGVDLLPGRTTRSAADATPQFRRISQADAPAVSTVSATSMPNRWVLVGVPMVAGLALMYVLRLVLGYPFVVRTQS